MFNNILCLTIFYVQQNYQCCHIFFYRYSNFMLSNKLVLWKNSLAIFFVCQNFILSQILFYNVFNVKQYFMYIKIFLGTISFVDSFYV